MCVSNTFVGKAIFSILGLLFVISLTGSSARAQFAGGDGSPEDPYQISTPAQLDAIRNDLDAHYELINDIDLDIFPYNSGEGWEPIADASITEAFMGSLDGQNFTISNLYINRPNETYVGFFSRTAGAKVKNIHFESLFVIGFRNVGGISGRSFNFGGTNLIINCSVTGIIFGKYSNVGGISGEGGTIENSRVTGAVRGESRIGGLIGETGSITESSFSGIVQGGHSIGGLIGYEGLVSKSFSTGVVSGATSVGGVIGYSENSILENSYSIADVYASVEAGGLVGTLSDGFNGGTIINSYAAGVVHSFDFSYSVGGLVGADGSEYGEPPSVVTNSYWNSDLGSPDNGVGTPITASQMKQQANFSGFDFSTVWNINSGSSYPYLRDSEQNPLPSDAIEFLNPIIEDFGVFSNGSGTELSPWQIDSPLELALISFYPDKHFELGADIDIAPFLEDPDEIWDRGWLPIGSVNHPFIGSLDGNGFTIENLSMFARVSYGGLFSALGTGGEITNMYLDSVSIMQSRNTGGLIGYNNGGIISNIHISGSIVDPDGDVGGLVSVNNSGIISGSSFHGNIEATDADYIGGLIGVNSGESAHLTLSFSTANISVSGSEGVSGLGGLVGLNENAAIVSKSYYKGQLYAVCDYCFGSRVGGLVGLNDNNAVISNSYSDGEIIGEGYVGGVSGWIDNSEVTDTYATGSIIVIGEDIVGGLVGYIWNSTISTSYWNPETTEQTEAFFGEFGENVIETVSLSTSQMYQASSFVGFDFENVWAISEENPFSFPYLRDLIPDPLPGIGLVKGGVLAMNGTESYAYIPDSSNIDFTNAFTAELWVKFDDVDRSTSGEEWMALASKGEAANAWGIMLNTANASKTLAFFHEGIGDDSTSFSWTNIQEDTWYHVAVSYDGSATTLYVDGTERASESGSGSLVTNDEDLFFGQQSGDNNYRLDGTVAEIRLWEDARTPAELQSNMNLMLSSKESGLVGAWVVRISGYENGVNFKENGNTLAFVNSTTDTTQSFPPLKASFDGVEGWRFIGAPDSTTTYAELLEPIWTQGFTGADSETGTPNVYYFDETTKSWKAPEDAAYLAGTASAMGSSLGKGLLVYVYADDDYDGNADPFPKTFSLDKPISSINEATVPLSYTTSEIWGNDGWNLVSNPYPVAVYWLDIVQDNANVNTEDYTFIWDQSLYGNAGGYRVNYGTPLPPALPGMSVFDGRIPAFQSFWVKAGDEEAQLELTPDHFIVNTQPFKAAKDETPFLKLTLNGDPFVSEVSVLFPENEEMSRTDIPRLNTLSDRHAEIAILDNNSQKWMAKYLVPEEENTSYSFPIDLSVTEAGEYTLSWDLISIPSGWEIEIEETGEGKKYDLREISSITIRYDENQEKKRSQSSGLRLPVTPGNKLKTNSGSDEKYVLHLKKISSTNIDTDPGLPTSFALSQNYPNPFNPTTSIKYELPENSLVELSVFDILGRKVATLVNGGMEAGYHEVTFDSQNLASGVYIYQLEAGNQVFTKKMTLIK